MKTNSKITLLNGSENNDYEVIASFIDKLDHEYIIYTDNLIDDDGFLKTYAGIKENNILHPLEDDDYPLVEDFLNRIDKE